MQTTLAAVNMAVSHDKAANLERILAFIEEAGDRGVDLLVLPEACLQGYIDASYPLGSPEQATQRRHFLEAAEPPDGPSLRQIATACRRATLYVQVGFVEATPSKAMLYNSVAIIGPPGVCSVYRKCHHGGEFPYFAPGNQLTCTRIGDITVGSLVCYDLAFPEVMRSHALKGAEVSLMSTAWPMSGHDREHDPCGSRLPIIARANAFFNQMWLVVSDHCETGAHSTNVDYYGGCTIIDPRGDPVASAGTGESMILHTTDVVAEVLRARTESFYGLTLLQDRRPELYEALWSSEPGAPGCSSPPGSPA